MANMKSLAKDTAIYGLSSIVGRFLNYLLVPLYTTQLSAASGGYGVITNMYAYTALILVLLTFGMETTFFRFANKEGEDPQKVYSTILTAVGFTSLVFIALIFTFITPLSDVMGYAEHPSYIWVMAITVAIDAFQCIPFAYLRYKKRPIKFAVLKMLFIVINILLNLVFFLVLPKLYADYPDVIGNIYDPSVGVGYAFYINLACTGMITFCFYKELTGFKYAFDAALMKRMLQYSWPILVLGIAGILNQTADKILFPYIYKAGSAYEPFVFGKAKDKDNRDTYAKAMKFFIIFTLLAFLVVMGYIDILKFLIGKDYWNGIGVIPIVMAAEIMMGIYFNLSFWYKLIDKTIWGAWFSGIGCAVLIAINLIFVPQYGYLACAWAGFAGYGTAMTLSYFVGQKYYPIKYDLSGIGKYVALALICFVIMKLCRDYIGGLWLILPNTLLILLFLAYIVKKDFPIEPILRKLGIRN